MLLLFSISSLDRDYIKALYKTSSDSFFEQSDKNFSYFEYFVSYFITLYSKALFEHSLAYFVRLKKNHFDRLKMVHV